ncbi:methanogenesis marker 3 protein [Methanothermobacter sp.]|uniref:methyl-coenzyme M reductase-associated protein Mmp3 n=1 Tax=Methanothermobacter sp. TaxID=1884223 RepID=UPI002616F917|nr:methanogenesis marker 3 protein [Methanothermobacter sp.]MDI9615263.1 methanogenesis marker 3 protein [Methanothermobacter sp.]
MFVKVNGVEVELPEGATVRDAIDATEAPYVEGALVGLISGTRELERTIDTYRIKTTAGSILIELLPEEAPEIVETWREVYSNLEDLRIRWTTPSEISMGPLKTELEPSRKEFFYDENEVIMSLSGFSPDSTHIIISRDPHSAVYGAPDENRGVFARVTGGGRTIERLTDRDVIRSVEPVVERKSIVESAAVTDLETPLEDGNQIFTYVKVKPSHESPQSVEHFFTMVEEGKLRVDYEANSFIGFYSLQGIKKDPEKIAKRNRGTVTLRNTGRGAGRVYIYREDRVSTPSHNLIGNVTDGMELVDIAGEGDHITVECEPGRIMTVSMTQKDAEEYLKGYGVEQIRDGIMLDDAIVVAQDPPYTMDILKEGRVRTVGIEADKILEVELDPDAPRSSWYFRRLTGLIDTPIGSLKVHFAFPGMKVVMFEGDRSLAKGLVPEKTPENCVKKGSIGITNMSRRHIGMVGVRLEDNDEYGPTGEPFNGTNIIGRITEGLENVEKFKEGDTVYVRERKKP